MLNSLNISLKGSGVTVLKAGEQILSFRDTSTLWGRRVNSGDFMIFVEITFDPLHFEGPNLPADIIAHLENLRAKVYFETCHPRQDTWLRCPFAVSLELLSDNDHAMD